MDKKVLPSSMTMNITLTEDKNRKIFAAKDEGFSQKNKYKQPGKEAKDDLGDSNDLLSMVNEANAILSSMGQNVLVLIHNNPDDVKIKILDSRTHTIITEMTANEFLEVARNLRNKKMNFLDRDA